MKIVAVLGGFDVVEVPQLLVAGEAMVVPKSESNSTQDESNGRMLEGAGVCDDLLGAGPKPAAQSGSLQKRLDSTSTAGSDCGVDQMGEQSG